MPIPVWAGILAGAAGSALGGIFGSKAEKEKAAVSREHLRLAEKARTEAKEAVSPYNIYTLGQWLFGNQLMRPPDDDSPTYRGTVPGTMGQMARGQISGAGRAMMKAKGGPVERGEDYIVGEEGPEKFVPKEDGVIIPNPRTQAVMGGPPMGGPEMAGPPMGGGGMPMGAGPQGGPEQGLAALTALIVPIVLQVLQEMLSGGPQGGPEGAGMGPEMGRMGEAPMMPMENEMGSMGPSGPAMGPTMGPGGIPGRAYGGAVQRGNQYWTGEQGAETFVPRSQANSNLFNNEVRWRPGRLTDAGYENLRNSQNRGGYQNRVEAGKGYTTWEEKNPGTRQLQPPQQYPGDLATQWMLEGLMNPGNMPTYQYERAQEIANRDYGAGQLGLAGWQGQEGVSGASPFAQGAQTALALGHERLQGENYRDWATAEEAFRRQDIADNTQRYLQFIQTLLGVAGAQSQAAAGQGYTPAQASSPYDVWAQGISGLGWSLASYFNQQNQEEGED